MSFRHNGNPIHASLTERRIISAVSKDNGIGFCIACGRKAKGFVEPDAEGYTCGFARCAGATVYGAEQLLLLTVA